MNAKHKEIHSFGIGARAAARQEAGHTIFQRIWKKFLKARVGLCVIGQTRAISTSSKRLPRMTAVICSVCKFWSSSYRSWRSAALEGTEQSWGWQWPESFPGLNMLCLVLVRKRLSSKCLVLMDSSHLFKALTKFDFFVLIYQLLPPSGELPQNYSIFYNF